MHATGWQQALVQLYQQIEIGRVSHMATAAAMLSACSKWFNYAQLHSGHRLYQVDEYAILH
jgi:hypothetical protein